MLKNELICWLDSKVWRTTSVEHSLLLCPMSCLIKCRWVLKHKGRKHSAYITDHPDFPLRKFVVNENGKKLTGSWSKGAIHKRYPFYRFGGNNSNHNRDNFEEAFMEYIDEYICF
jgi:hypothetical protein